MPVAGGSKKRPSTGAAPAAKKSKKAVDYADGRRPSVSSSAEPSSSEDEANARGRKGKGKAASDRPKKQYIPLPRSGGWGILIALYTFCTEESQKKFRTKDEIIELAQPYCDKSFTEAESRHGGQGGSGYMNCWNNMKTLTNKDYVLQTNTRPKKYALTKEGFEVAIHCAAQEGVAILDVDLSRVTATMDDPELSVEVKSKGKSKAKAPETVAAPTSDRNGYGRSEDDLAADQDILAALAVPRPRKEPDARDRSWLAALARQDAASEEAELSGLFDARRSASVLGAPEPRINPAAPVNGSGSAAASGSSKGAHKRTGEALNGQLAAAGAYARNYKEPVKEVRDSLAAKHFEYEYLTTGASDLLQSSRTCKAESQTCKRTDNRRSRKQKDADCSMHPETYETTYKIEFRLAQSLHPFCLSSVCGIDKNYVREGGRGPEGATGIGWLLQSKTTPQAPGFAALSSTALKGGHPSSSGAGVGAPVAKKAAVNDLMMGKSTAKKLDPKAMYAAPSGTAFSGTALQRTHSAPVASGSGSGGGGGMPRPAALTMDKRTLSSAAGLPSSSSGLPRTSSPPPPASTLR